MSIQFKIVDDHGIQPYSKALKEIEGSILYPLSETEDQFAIVHGDHYHCFFTGMGKTRFILALDNNSVCGIAALTWKKVIINNKGYTGLYLSDIKLAKPYRGKKIMLRMGWFCFIKWLSNQRYRGFDFIFGAAMRNSTSDVTRSFTGMHLGKLARSAAVLDIYFCPPEKLTHLTGSAPPYPRGDTCARLSLVEDSIKDNTGVKEFRLESTGQAWPLIHLPFPVSRWSDGLGTYLQDCAQQLLQPSQSPVSPIACFSLDRRLSAQRQWLTDNNIQPGGVCTVYEFSLPFFGKSPFCHADHIHLSTSEI